MVGPDAANDVRTGALRRVGAQMSALVVAQAGASASSFALSVLLASALGPAHFGTYALFLSVATAAATPFIWVTSAIVVFGQEDVERNGNARRSVTAITLFCAALLLAVLAALALGQGAIVSAFPSLAGMTPLVPVSLTATLSVSVTLGVLQARHAMRSYATFTLTLPVMSLILTAVGLAVLGPLPAVVVLTTAIAQVVASIPFLLGASRALPGPTVDPKAVIDLGRFAAASLAGAVQGYIQNYADVVILGLFIAPTALGQYAFAVRVYQQLLVFAQLVGIVGLPILNQQRVRRRDDLVREYLDRRGPQILACVVPLCAVLATIGGFVIHAVFASTYDMALPVLSILMAALVVATWRRISSPVLTSYRLLWEGNAAALVAAAIFALTILLAGPRLGAPAGAIATYVAVWADVAVVSVFLRRKLDVAFPLRVGAIALLAVPVVAAGTVALPDLFLSSLLLAAALTGYLGVLRLLRVFDHDDSEILSRALPPRVRPPFRMMMTLIAVRTAPRATGSS